MSIKAGEIEGKRRGGMRARQVALGVRYCKGEGWVCQLIGVWYEGQVWGRAGEGLEYRRYE